MCLKVANQRSSGDDRDVRFPPQSDDVQDQQPEAAAAINTAVTTTQELLMMMRQQQSQYAVVPQQPPPPPPLQQQQMNISGYSRPTEMSAIVSALTHVVSGRRGSGSTAGNWGSHDSRFRQQLYSPSSPCSSGSGSWISGQKRNRDDEEEETAVAAAQLHIDSAPQQRPFRPDESSSASATGN